MQRISPLLAIMLVAGLAGCELVADFDRDKIPVERPDAGPAMDASMADAAAEPDEDDVPEPQDAGDGTEPPEEDSGVDGDAGVDDAGSE